MFIPVSNVVDPQLTTFSRVEDAPWSDGSNGGNVAFWLVNDGRSACAIDNRQTSSGARASPNNELILEQGDYLMEPIADLHLFGAGKSRNGKNRGTAGPGRSWVASRDVQIATVAGGNGRSVYVGRLTYGQRSHVQNSY